MKYNLYFIRSKIKLGLRRNVDKSDKIKKWLIKTQALSHV